MVQCKIWSHGSMFPCLEAVFPIHVVLQSSLIIKINCHLHVHICLSTSDVYLLEEAKCCSLDPHHHTSPSSEQYIIYSTVCKCVSKTHTQSLSFLRRPILTPDRSEIFTFCKCYEVPKVMLNSRVVITWL